MDSFKPTVLIVDDSVADLTLMSLTLKDNGYSTEVAFDGVQALSIAKEHVPDVIILDVLMPHIDGLELCKIIKDDKKLKAVPVIMVTGNIEKDLIFRVFESGASDYISKPFNQVELLARLKKHLNSKNTIDKLTRQNDANKELLHILCHDLSTPFNGVISIKEILAEIESLDKLKEYFELVNFSASQGLDIISLVRKMRVASEGKIELSKCRLKESIDTSFVMLRKMFNEKNLRLDLNVDENLYVYAEKTSLVNSVLNNILTNALKFSFSDSFIKVNAVKNNGNVLLTIKDNGVGMSKNIMGNLFKMSKVTTRKGTNGELGTGFGMSLIHKFVTAYGGNININSVPASGNNEEHGTEVKITFKSVGN